jgi:D-alanine--poly(phosphoribitol) ligase subunit 2
MIDKVLDIFEEVTGTDELREDLDLDIFEAGLLDSLGIIEVLLKIEEVFQIKLQPTDLERKDMATVNNLVSFLENLKVGV